MDSGTVLGATALAGLIVATGAGIHYLGNYSKSKSEDEDRMRGRVSNLEDQVNSLKAPAK